MPQHEVELLVSHPIQIGKRDIEIPVRADGAPLGRLKVSKGGVDWLPSPNSKGSFRMDWQRFAASMEQHGRKH